jgi:hypothetical protein
MSGYGAVILGVRLRILVFICILSGLWAQPAPKLTGFPFQDESLRYRILWPGGNSLGDVTFSAHHGSSGWNLETSLNASVPGFAVRDDYRASATDALCSTEFTRTTSHGSKKSSEKITFDAHARRATRQTTLPPDGGKSDFDIPPCARDAVTFLYFVRREMGQGRVAPQEKVYLGSGYSVRLQYTGEMTIQAQNKPAVTDHVVVSIKGPSSDVSAEVFFARDAARTPLLIKVPLSLGTVSVELVR